MDEPTSHKSQHAAPSIPEIPLCCILQHASFECVASSLCLKAVCTSTLHRVYHVRLKVEYLHMNTPLALEIGELPGVLT